MCSWTWVGSRSCAGADEGTRCGSGRSPPTTRWRAIRWCGPMPRCWPGLRGDRRPGGATAARWAGRCIRRPGVELPTAAVALGAECRITGPAGNAGPAAHFVAKGPLHSPDELVTGIRVPKWPGWSFHYERFHRPAVVRSAAAAGAPRRRVIAAPAWCRQWGLRRCGLPPWSGVHRSSEPGCPARAARAVDEVLPSDSASGDVEHRGLARVLTGRALITAAGV